MIRANWQYNNILEGNPEWSTSILSKREVLKARSFHESFPQYSPTPMAKLNNLAMMLGLGGIVVKDESFRFGLNAFKVLGGSYAMGSYIAKKLGEDISKLDFHALTSDDLKQKLGEITFFTATDGNHGRGVAWAANQLNQKSVVYMPVGSSRARLENILKEGSDASITDLNYDDAVRLAAKNSEKTPNSVIIQDTAWEGYTDIPIWIMQGYGTMASEAMDQLLEMGIERPTHIFIQAGVGSLAGAVQGFFSSIFKDNPPKVVIVESDQADCLYQSARAADGDPRLVTGDMQTIMAGLACGEPNIISWDILKKHSDTFISSPDPIAALGMRILANPLKGDDKVVSGESGAVTTGILYEIMQNSLYFELRDHLELNENSKVLLFSTEGNTDPHIYRDICWKGKYSFNQQ